MVRMRARAGFTLIEAMLTVTILGIVASLGTTVMIQTNRFFVQAKARADLQRQARGIMYIVTREMRQAQNATIVISRLSNTQPYYSMIKFTKEQGTVVTVYQDGNLLCLATNPGTVSTGGGSCKVTGGGNVQTLSTDLSYLAFSFPRSDDMTIVSVAMTLEEIIYQGKLKALHMASEKVQVMD